MLTTSIKRIWCLEPEKCYTQNENQTVLWTSNKLVLKKNEAIIPHLPLKRHGCLPSLPLV